VERPDLPRSIADDALAAEDCLTVYTDRASGTKADGLSGTCAWPTCARATP
jgi:hypothetical protein